MRPEVVVDWLAKNDAYAKAIVNLAGIRVGPVSNGIPIRIEALWDYPEFRPPLVYAIPLDEGTMFWSSDTTKTGLFRKTLGLLTETFSSLNLPKKIVVFAGEIDPDAKRLHFRSFMFGDSHVVPAKTCVLLNKTVGEPAELADMMHRFIRLSKKLKGIGLDGC